MKRLVTATALACLLPQLARAQQSVEATADLSQAGPIVRLLAEELDYSMGHLATPEGTKPYYLSYTITDRKSVSVSAVLGALHDDDFTHDRLLDVDVRVGAYELDNTHKLRGDQEFDFHAMFAMATPVGTDDDRQAIKHTVWRTTDTVFKQAAQKFQRVQTNQKTKVEEDMTAADFSREEPSVFFGEEAGLSIDRAAWSERLRRVSALARRYPTIYTSEVSLSGSAENTYIVNSEGTRIRQGRALLRVLVSAGTKAEDGMELDQSFIFSASTVDGLPSEDEIAAALQRVIDQVLALREAPLVEPYTGPAILMNRASGVFFHEIFGHRIEGHRQKDVEEGQTFTKKVGQEVLPPFLSVCDDPTLARFEGEDLRGHYRFDDEGVPAARVNLIEQGVLKTFLLSRSPLEDFSKSNGHGRRQPGHGVVARQGNLMVESTRAVSFDRLRELLIEECVTQGKPYGLLFEDITGGFTTTARYGPQAFKVLPVVVHRIYPDGRQELVRGVDIVGTPLSCFSKILCTGDDPAVFNGTCGAESGWVPVSAISPSILVSQIEIEKRERSQELVPILASPLDAHGVPVEASAKKDGK